jgi:hypothetical protein
LAQRRDVPEESIKQAVASLPDVQSCKIEFDPGGQISAIHVVSRTKRPAKQIVRDIESVLQAEFGIEVDHRKVSIARLAEKPEPKPPQAPRPKLVSVSLSLSSGIGQCQVVLERQDFQAKGEASGIAAQGGGLRLIAKATLRAVERLVGQDIEFDLLDVVKLRLGGRKAIVVLASLAAAGGVRNLAGCVQFVDNEHQAVVQAALDACNRVVERLPHAERTEYEITPLDES